MQTPTPPRWADQLLEWFCAPHLLEEVQGDLHERFQKNLRVFGAATARTEYIKGVLGFIRPFAVKRKTEVSASLYIQIMISNYFKVAFRNLLRYKGYSFINIFGLATGMAVAMLIGLWIYDEVSYNRYHKNYDSVAQVLENQHLVNEISTFSSLPIPLAIELRDTYGSNFKNVAATLSYDQTIAHGNNVFTKTGCYSEPAFPEMLSLEMLRGTKDALKDPNAILINESLAEIIFGNANPINQAIKLNNAYQVRVAGVYKDMPRNSQFNNIAFIAPVSLVFDVNAKETWRTSSFQIYVQLHPNANISAINKQIKNVLYEHSKDASKPELFLFPMRQWHLYSEFKNGVNAGGRIEFVWLFGIIGVFVLLLACINFMNLSTARSEKRAKEVGIRKAIGSVRGQLIAQFFSESLLVVLLAFVLSIGMVILALPFFNKIADKETLFLWREPIFWVSCIGFTLFTGLITGSYPALYLSSFQPVKVLKGTLRLGRFAALPRKVLLVMQFTVSVTLIIGTIVVFRQIIFAKNRPVGYSREGLLMIPLTTGEIQKNYKAFHDELLQTRVIAGVARSSSPMTGIWSSANNLEWRGKDPNVQAMFGTICVEPDYGKVVAWEMKEGRNFSEKFSTDSSAFVFNESAIKQMGLKNPIGEIVRWHDKDWKIIGIAKDMVMRSPFEPIEPTVFMIDDRQRPFNIVDIKINPAISSREALDVIEPIYKKYAPNSPFNYKFASQEYESKFKAEERIGTLATFFAVLAIFISCLGLFGLASFIAEQRTKEIGIRKVLGASVVSLWGMLSKDFVMLVVISCVIATPVAYHFMNSWLQKYTYRTEISWWIFVIVSAGAMIICLLTISYQAIKAALMNPVKTLKNE